MAEKKAVLRITTPKGLAKFPKLNAPDTKFKKDGEFSVKLLLDADAAETIALCAELQKLSEEAFAEQKAELKPAKQKTLQLYLPFKDEEHHETGELTGMVEMTFKMNASYKDKKTDELVVMKPRLFDSVGQALDAKVNVGMGSIIRVNFTPFGFYTASGNMAGVSLRLNAVQVIKLKTFGGASADEYGFGVEDEGFVREQTKEAESSVPAEGDGDF